MSEQPQSVNIDDEDDERFANQLAFGFAISIPFSMLIGLLVFDQIGLGIAFGVVLGPLVAMMLKKLPLG